MNKVARVLTISLGQKHDNHFPLQFKKKNCLIEVRGCPWLLVSANDKAGLAAKDQSQTMKH